jgi:hypothetical protein
LTSARTGHRNWSFPYHGTVKLFERVGIAGVGIFLLHFAILTSVIPRVHMSLCCVPERTAEDIRLLVEGAVREIGDATVTEGLI